MLTLTTCFGCGKFFDVDYTTEIQVLMSELELQQPVITAEMEAILKRTGVVDSKLESEDKPVLRRGRLCFECHKKVDAIVSTGGGWSQWTFPSSEG